VLTNQFYKHSETQKPKNSSLLSRCYKKLRDENYKGEKERRVHEHKDLEKLVLDPYFK
jgi:hypothetical protein